MLTFNDGFQLPTANVNQLASIGVMVLRLRAESTVAKARTEVARHLELHRGSHDHLAHFADAMQVVRRRQVRPVAE